MGKYILSEYFTLIPKEVYTHELAGRILSDQFSMDMESQVGAFVLEKENAVVAFRQESRNGETCLPFVVKLLDEATQIDAYNKVVFHYLQEKGIAHIIIYTGEDLKLANSFKADSFESALYFLFLSIKGLQMNPKQCVVRVCWQITSDQESVFAKFFNGFKINDLNIFLV